MKKITVLDFLNGKVRIYDFGETYTGEEVEDYLFNTLGYNEGNIEWIITDSDKIIYEVD